MTEGAGKPVFRFMIWLVRRVRSGHPQAGQATGGPADLAAYTVQDAPAELVTVRLPDGRVVQASAQALPEAPGRALAWTDGSRIRRSC
jgi:hypothetical protein